MSNTTEDMLAKVEKLLALAASGNEHEAALAASKAQELLAKYNLDLSMLGAASTKAEKRGQEEHDKAAMYKYQRRLMETLANINFCRHRIIEGMRKDPKGVMRKAKRHVLIGRTVNVRATQQMYDYLVTRMDDLLPYQGMEKRGKAALLWLEGATATLCRRLRDKRREMERETEKAAQTGSGMSLVVVTADEDDYNNDIENGWPLGTTAEQKAQQKASYAEVAAKTKARLEEAQIMYPHAPEFVHRHMSYGYTFEEAMKNWEEHQAEKAKAERAAAKPETEAQRRKREERDARYNERYWAKREKQMAKYDDPAYQAGRRAAKDISLDDQIDHETHKGIK